MFQSTQTRNNACTHTHTHTHTRKQARTHACTRTHAHARTHAHTHTYTHLAQQRPGSSRYQEAGSEAGKGMSPDGAGTFDLSCLPSDGWSGPAVSSLHLCLIPTALYVGLSPCPLSLAFKHRAFCPSVCVCVCVCV